METDRLSRAAPQWCAFAVLGACYTLFEAPFWDAALQKSLGISNDGSYVQMLITCASVGNMAILAPGMLADQYPPWRIAYFGGLLVAVGYSVLGMGLVSIEGSPPCVVGLTVLCYAWGVAWIYAAAFVTVMNNIGESARGKAIGVVFCAFLFSPAWYTEITEYCCVAGTTFEKSAWRHMPIALTTICCAPGLYRLPKGEACSSKDAHLDKISLGLAVLVALDLYQWAVAKGTGSRDLLLFAEGDIPFFFFVLYFVILGGCVAVNARNYMVHGLKQIDVVPAVEVKTSSQSEGIFSGKIVPVPTHYSWRL